jgi:hypothetical protein
MSSDLQDELFISVGETLRWQQDGSLTRRAARSGSRRDRGSRQRPLRAPDRAPALEPTAHELNTRAPIYLPYETIAVGIRRARGALSVQAPAGTDDASSGGPMSVNQITEQD